MISLLMFRLLILPFASLKCITVRSTIGFFNSFISAEDAINVNVVLLRESGVMSELEQVNFSCSYKGNTRRKSITEGKLNHQQSGC